MNRIRSGAYGALLAATFVLVSAMPASAHAAHVTHQETCTDDGQTTTVVTFDNDYAAPADVTYQWGTEPPGTAHLAARTGSANTTVALPSHPAGTLAWHVTWADGYRQPPSGESTLTVEPLADCHPATTTSTAPATTTTQMATTTTTALATTSTTAKAAGLPATTTTLPATVLGSGETLPRTGAPLAFWTAIGLLCLLLAAGPTLYARKSRQRRN